MGKKKSSKPAAQRKGKGYAGAGRPTSAERKIVPDDYDHMMRLYGTGWTMADIARKYQVAYNTIRTHFRDHIFPLIQAGASRSIESELLKINVLERVAWKCFYSTDPTERRQMIRSEQAKLKNKTKEERAQIETMLEKTLVNVHKSQDKAWLDVIRWCIDTRLRLEGHYAAVKVHVRHEEYRVAGQRPIEHMEKMNQRIQEKVAAMRQQQARVQESQSFSDITAPSKN